MACSSWKAHFLSTGLQTAGTLDGFHFVESTGDSDGDETAARVTRADRPVRRQALRHCDEPFQLERDAAGVDRLQNGRHAPRADGARRCVLLDVFDGAQDASVRADVGRGLWEKRKQNSYLSLGTLLT